MGWDSNNYPFDEQEEEPRRSLTGFLIGLGLAAITLLVIAAFLLNSLSSLLLPKINNARSQAAQSSRAVPVDLVSANYRPSQWQEPASNLLTTPTPVAPEIVAEADAEYQLLANIYERVNPSVVNIEIVSGVHAATDAAGIIDSSGSGFVVDMDGHIATNAHVVRDAQEILVTFFDGTVLEATVVGIDDYSDLAVIKVDPAQDGVQLVPVVLGDSNALHVGQRVIAIGNPFGLDGSMTVGIVSALGRSLPSAQLLDPITYDQYNNPSIIQVDAAVNPGNSGGPLLDSYGQVIGINTAIRTETGTFEGIAFAVPVNTMKRVVPQLIAGQKVQYSYLGITSTAGEPGLSMATIASELELPVRNGVLVETVADGSPAQVAGIQGGDQVATVRGFEVSVNGDIIVAINGSMVRDIDDLVAYLVENTSPGDKVVLTLIRNGQTLDVDVTLGVRP